MAALINDATALLATVIAWIGDIADLVMQTPIFMVGFLMVLIGFAISVIKRLTNV